MGIGAGVLVGAVGWIGVVTIFVIRDLRNGRKASSLVRPVLLSLVTLALTLVVATIAGLMLSSAFA